MAVPFMLAHRPAPVLRGHLRRVAGFAEHTGGAQFRRELPTPGLTLIVGLGDRIRLSSATGAGTYTSFLAGLHEIPVDTEHDGSLRCIQVDLTPLGAYQLLGMPMSELTDTVVGLDALPGWPRLADRLAHTSGWADRFALLEDDLGDRLAAGPRADPEVRWAWQRLARSHGAVSVGTLATEVGWSRRHFTARFRRQVGLAPKPAAQVLRFQRALGMLTAPAPGTISDVAARAGYADHSHLTREFRRLTGAPPSALIGG